MSNSGGADRGVSTVASGDGRVATVAGMLLTGGASRRMGMDKASLVIDGMPSAPRLGHLLAEACTRAIEVGPGRSSLPAVADDRPDQGPLVAVVTGWRTLRDTECPDAVVVLACDLPLLTATLVGLLVTWPTESSLVPVVGGHPQPLCAKWSAPDLERAVSLAGAGRRSMRDLLDQSSPVLLDEAEWSSFIDPVVFSDVDTVADLDRLGVQWSSR